MTAHSRNNVVIEWYWNDDDLFNKWGLHDAMRSGLFLLLIVVVVVVVVVVIVVVVVVYLYILYSLSVYCLLPLLR